MIRFFFALKRLVKFVIILNSTKLDGVIIFFATGLSAVEKSFMVIISKYFNIKIIVFPRAGALITDVKDKFFFSKFIKFALNKVDAFLCQGQTFQKFANKILKIEKKKTFVIPNWTATSNLLSIGKKKKYKAKKNVNILFLGWLEEFKGVKELLNVAKILKDKKIRYKLILAGNGNLFSYVNQYIIKNKLTSSINVEGWVSIKRRKELLEKSDIFVLPSWSEGFPNSLIEALSSGLSCVITDVGMIRDFIKNNHNGVIIKKKNIFQLFQALEKLISRPDLRKKIGKNGFKLSKKFFFIDNSISLLTRTINKILCK